MTDTKRQKSKQLTRCHCRVNDCKEQTLQTFAPGHDARLIRALSDLVLAGGATEQTAVRQLHERGGTEALAAKLVQVIVNKRARRKPKSAGQEPARGQAA